MPKTRLQLRTSVSQSSDQPSTSKDDDRFMAKTPEHADTGSKTPEAEQPERPESPQNCSICLSGVENKSFTDSCLHTFCYVCLLEWSKVKAVCPLCKQPFKKLIYNVRSLDDFDEYVIPPPAPTRDHLWENFNASNYAMSARFRYRTTVTADRMAEYQRRRHPAGRYGRALGAPSTRAVSRAEERRRRQHQALVSRRRVYDNDLWVQPVSPTRYRETSPAFYSENEACRYQLIPWLSRELNILLNGHEDNIHFVLELILDLIQRFEIRSEEFYELIHPLIGRHARHFIHEFYYFARSPYNMMVYDERASYRTGRAEGERGERAQEARDESDEDEVMVLEEEVSTEGEDSRSGLHHELSRRAGIPIANLGPINIEWNMTSALGDVRAFLQNVMSQESGAAQMARIHSHHNYAGQRERSGASSANLETAAAAAAAAFSVSPTTAAQPVNIEDESDEDDVIFVKYEKPYAERSPIMLSSESEAEMAGDERRRPSSDPSRRRHGSSDRGQRSRSRDRHRRDKRKKSDHKKSSRRRSRSRERRSPGGRRSKSPKEGSRSRDNRSGSRDRKVRSPKEGSRSRDYRSRSCDKRSRSRDRRSRSRNRKSKSRDRPGSGARAYDLSVHRNRSPRSRDYITKSMSLDVPRPRDRRSRSSSRHRSPYSSSASRMQRRRSRSLERSMPRSHESSQRKHRERSTSRDRRRSRSRSVERRRKQDEHESRRRRHSSSDDVEITRIRRKRAKKHKKHKKHKKQNKRRRVSADDAGNDGGETAEEPSTSGENRKYKKHPTGHKSSKRKHSLDVLPKLSSVVVQPSGGPENVVSSGFESGDFSGDSAVDLTAVKTTNDTGDVINDVTGVTLTSQEDSSEKTDDSPSCVVKSVLDELISRVVPLEETQTKSVNFDSPEKPLEILANVALLDSVPRIPQHILADQSLPLKLLDLSTKNIGKNPSLFDEFRDKNGVNIEAKDTISPTKSSDSDCIMTADDDVVFEGECRCRARQKCAKCLNSSDSSSSEDSDSDSDSGSISPVVRRRKFDSNASSPALPRFLRVGTFPYINSMFGTPPRRFGALNLSGDRRSEPVRIDLDSGSDHESSAIIDVENSEPEIDVETVPTPGPDNVNIDDTTSDSDELNVESIERSVSPLVDPITVIDNDTSCTTSVQKRDSRCMTANKSPDEPSSSTQNLDLTSAIDVERETPIDVETLSSSPLKIGSPVLSSLSEPPKIFAELMDCQPLLESSAIADEVDILSTSDGNVDVSDLLSSDRDSPRPKTPQFEFDIDVENVDKVEIANEVENVDETLVVDSSTDLEVDVEVSESN